MDYPARLRSTRFWLVAAAALAGMAGTAALGSWQLSRAAQKEQLQARIDERRTLAPVAGASLLQPQVVELVDRRIGLRGEWLDAHTVLLENRQMNGLPGFYVLTPLRLEGLQAAVVVQRGWVQRDFQQRERAAVPAAAVGIVEVQGRIVPPPSRLYAFSGADQGRIRQNLDLQAFAAETRLPLVTAVSVVQMDVAADGLRRDWQQPATEVEKHYGYAFQWFGLCATIAGLFVWFQFIAPRRAVGREKKA